MDREAALIRTFANGQHLDSRPTTCDVAKSERPVTPGRVRPLMPPTQLGVLSHMIPSAPTGVKPGTVDDRDLPTDDRIAWFIRLVYAADTGDAKAGLALVNALRQLGYSVCLIKPPGRGGA